MNVERMRGRSKELLRAVVRETRAEHVTFMAGSIAYHAFVSLLPFLMLVLLLVSRLGGEDLAMRVLEVTAGYLTFTTRQLLVSAARQASRHTGLSAVGLAVLLWGTLKIFRGLDAAFSEIYETEAANTYADQLRDGVVVLVTIGLAVLTVSSLDALVRVTDLGALQVPLKTLFGVVGLAVVFLPMYYVFPDADVTVREVLPGTVLAATGWVTLESIYRIYIQMSAKTEYGVVGAIILFITWLYFSGLVLLLGAVVNAVLAGRSEDVQAIAWGEPVGTDAAHDDAAFVAPLEQLAAALEEGEEHAVEFTVGDTSVTVPPPTEASVDVETADRPVWLGGDRETARVTLSWDSWD